MHRCYRNPFISQKGGAGKTTLAIALAVTAERTGLSSVLVDLDPQASAAQWSDLREAETPVVTCTPAARLISVLTAAQDAGAGLAVLDTAPLAADAALAAARASDFVLIPCRPATADLVAIGANINLIRIADKPGAVGSLTRLPSPIRSRPKPVPPSLATV